MRPLSEERDYSLNAIFHGSVGVSNDGSGSNAVKAPVAPFPGFAGVDSSKAAAHNSSYVPSQPPPKPIALPPVDFNRTEGRGEPVDIKSIPVADQVESASGSGQVSAVSTISKAGSGSGSGTRKSASVEQDVDDLPVGSDIPDTV